jgi:prophage antirepressor-like protein
MNDLTIFKNPRFGEVRMILIDGKEHFVAADIARALGYRNPPEAIRDHCKGIAKCYIPTAGGQQEMNCIPMGDVCRLVANSELPGAAEYESWIFDEVIPTIHKTGGYVHDSEMFVDSYFPELPKAERTVMVQLLDDKKRLLAENKELKPKGAFYDTVTASPDWESMDVVAKVLNLGYGRNTLFAKLRDLGILDGDNYPYQRYIDRGYFRLIEQQGWKDHAGTWHPTYKTLVSQRGIDFIWRTVTKPLSLVN